MNIALDDLVVHQPVDDVGALPLGRAEHGRVPQQVAFVAEGVGGHALFFAEIFEGVVSVQGIDAHLEFLPVAGGRGYTREAAIRPNKHHRTGNDRIACSYSPETSAIATQYSKRNWLGLTEADQLRPRGPSR